MKVYDSIIEELAHSRGYNAALMTTFNIEYSFFEKYLIHILLNNQIRHINLFTDAKQTRAALHEDIPVHFGKKYYISPIDIHGAFHPKVILLLGEKKAKLIISSANIKMSGYMANCEIFQTFIYDEENNEYQGIIYQAIEMFRALNSLTPVPDSSTQALLNKFDISEPVVYGNGRLLCNLENSIMDQLTTFIHEDIRQIRIAVPFYDQNLEALRSFKDFFKCQDVQLYVQDEMNTFPMEYNVEHGIVASDQVIPFEAVQIGDRKKTFFYHGKVFELIGMENTYVLYGSANCSGSALLRTYKQSGNIECSMFEQKDPQEPSFFTAFQRTDSHELRSSLYAGNDEIIETYWFAYSVLHQESLEVFLKYKAIHNDLSISLSGNEIRYARQNNMLVLQIPLHFLDEQNSIFDLNVSFGDQSQVVRCWYINSKKLEFFRKNISSLGFMTQFNEEDSKQYGDYWNAVFDALFDEEYKEYIEEIRSEMSAKTAAKSYENDEEEATEEDSGQLLLGKDISDQYVERNTVFSAAYDATKKYANAYYASLLKSENSKSSIKHTIVNPKKEEEEEKPRKATPEDKKIARFIRRNLKKHFLFTDPEMLSYDYYVHLCGIVMYVIDKMIYKEKKEDFMSPDEIVRIKSVFAELLIDKFSDAQNDEDEELLIRNCLATIIELWKFKETEKDDLARKLLQKLNRKINIRETYRDYVELLDLNKIVNNNNLLDIDTYIRKLFNYRTFKELQDYFESLYHSECILRREGTVFNILINAKGRESIGESIIQEVLKYLKEYETGVKTIHFYYANKEGADILYIVKFAGLHTNSVNKQCIRSNGTTEFKCTKKGSEWSPEFFTT